MSYPISYIEVFTGISVVDYAAFKAGHDLLLISEDIGKGINKLTEGYNSGEISESRLAHSVKKVLMAKYKVGLNNYKPIEIIIIQKSFSCPSHYAI